MNRLRLALVFVILLAAFASSSAHAATLSWDRVADADTDHYNVYGCFTKGCTPTQDIASKQPGSIPQTPVGTVPSFPVTTTGKTGAYAVSASDVSGNESGLSVAVPFDAVPPAVPMNPRLNP